MNNALLPRMALVVIAVADSMSQPLPPLQHSRFSKHNSSFEVFGERATVGGNRLLFGLHAPSMMDSAASSSPPAVNPSMQQPLTPLHSLKGTASSSPAKLEGEDATGIDALLKAIRLISLSCSQPSYTDPVETES
jgi:hypothetical protein